MTDNKTSGAATSLSLGMVGIGLVGSGLAAYINAQEAVEASRRDAEARFQLNLKRLQYSRQAVTPETMFEVLMYVQECNVESLIQLESEYLAILFPLMSMPICSLKVSSA